MKVCLDLSLGIIDSDPPFNLSHSLHACDRKDSTSTQGKCTPQSLEHGVIEIAKALWGKYTDVQGTLKSVGGDMTRVCYVPGLSPAALI